MYLNWFIVEFIFYINTADVSSNFQPTRKRANYSNIHAMQSFVFFFHQTLTKMCRQMLIVNIKSVQFFEALRLVAFDKSVSYKPILF